MKKILAIVALTGLLGTIVSPAMATPDEDKKVTICHATGSATNPFVEISISKNALKAHFSDKHQEGEDTFGPCPTAVPTETPTPAPTVTPTPVETTVPTPTPTESAEVPVETAIPVPPNDKPKGSEIPAETYPAPVVTPNTVNGVPQASTQPTPIPLPTRPASQVNPDRLADTGAEDLLWLWGGVGLLALLAGVASVIHARRNA